MAHNSQDSDNPFSVIHCHEFIGSHSQALAQAERELGIDSRFVSLRPHLYGYQADEILAADNSFLKAEVKRWKLLWCVIKNFDLIHFTAGISMMPKRIPYQILSQKFHPLSTLLYMPYAGLLEMRDLPVLKRLGKKIVVTYFGSDARQDDYCRQNFEITHADEYLPDTSSRKNDILIRNRIKKMNQYADHIFYLNPDLQYILPSRATFLPYANTLVGQSPQCETVKNNKPLIVHAPSKRNIKGTNYVLKAVDELRDKNCKFDFMLLENKTNEEVQRIFQRADLLIDQLLIGWYGTVAVEFMALGKPVMAYLRDQDFDCIPSQMKNDLPIINATPKTIVSVLFRWLMKNEHNNAKDISNFVVQWHSPSAVAQITVNKYQYIIKNKK